MQFWRCALLALTTTTTAAALYSQPAGKHSPFVPAAPVAPAPAPAADAELEALQLGGISVIGSNQTFNLVDTRTRASFWVALNATERGITVTSYDPARDSVVVKRGPHSRTLFLRQSVIVNAPAAAPAQPVAAPPQPPAPTPGKGVDEIANPRTPQEIAQAETEARMLVSDLLEISMQERARQRALREQQQRQQGNPPPAAAPAPIAPPR